MTIYDEINASEIEKDLRYLKQLSKQYPDMASASTEIIHLEAILNLPKGTEHFISDIHGEYESFTHMLKNASGVIKRKIDEQFSTLTKKEKRSLATLIYYPEEKLSLIKQTEDSMDDWYKITLYRLIEFCRAVSSKYSRSKLRKALPKNYEYIMEELLQEHRDGIDKQEYYSGIINAIIDTDRASEFIIVFCNVIQRLIVDRLHIIGDIYDRGPGPEIIMEALTKHHSVDMQWGNHDILWMSAAAGCEACISNVLRIALRYANLGTIEDGYGINLLPLATFALEFYADDPCKSFKIKTLEKEISDMDYNLLSKMHKAISIIQFKLEGHIIKRHPEFRMDDQLLLDMIDYDSNTINMNGESYQLNDTNFPTIDWCDPYKLTPREWEVLAKLKNSFLRSDKLQKHIRFMYSKGSMYTIFNSNLLFHGCIPLKEDKSFEAITLHGQNYSGKSMLDKFDRFARDAYFMKENSEAKKTGLDMMWYLWCGARSPLFGKELMTTFERYFIDNPKTHHEERNYYYKYRDDEKITNDILIEFGLDPECSHVINGHIPVKTKEGESPVKANGKLLVIDGGFCRAYQPQTGIAGYTLIYNSYGLLLTSHEPFESIKKAIEEEDDILSSTIVLESSNARKQVADTDLGSELKEEIHALKMLLTAYREGYIKETLK
ncbi:MAG: fructose-1,6-bisphosphatase [Clostridiaceae bacterium]